MTAHIYIRGEKGGSGSGNWGHVGRPGLVGGSGGGAGMAMGAGQASGGDNANQFLNEHGEDWITASDKERENVKRTIVSELAERSGVDTDIINQVITQWAYTSNGSVKALSLQEAAAEELGLKLSAWQQGKLDATVDGERITSRANERAIIRAMYDHTQEELAKAGYSPGDTIALVRGVTYGNSPGRVEGDIVDYKGNAMESWSLGDITATEFATGGGAYDYYGEVVSMAVPVSSIIGTARTGYGCLIQGEFVIAGNVPGSKATVHTAVKPYHMMTEGEIDAIDWTAGWNV